MVKGKRLGGRGRGRIGGAWGVKWSWAPLLPPPPAPGACPPFGQRFKRDQGGDLSVSTPRDGGPSYNGEVLNDNFVEERRDKSYKSGGWISRVCTA